MYELALTYYIIYASLLVGVMFYSIRLFYTRNYRVNNKMRPRVVLFIALVLMAVFSATGDYWTYRRWYDTGIENLHFEPIWVKIRTMIPWGFDMFRLILWGGCLSLFTIMCKWHKSDLLITFTLFALFYIFGFSYARATIAYMLIFFAYYLIVMLKVNHYRRWLMVLIVVAFCVSIGLQMHRSMLILLAILAVSLFLKPQKNIIIALIILFPIISLLFNTVLYPYVMTYITSDVDTSRLVDTYLMDTRGIIVFIRTIISNLPFLLLYFVSFVNIIKKEESFKVKKIAFSAFLIVYFAFIFYTIRAGNGLVFFYRTLNMAYPFMIMSVAYSMKYINNMYKLTFAVVIYQVLFQLLAIYQLLANPNYLYNQVYERYL